MVLGATSPIVLPVCAFAKKNLAKLVERTRKSGVDCWFAAATTKSITLSVLLLCENHATENALS
jgi:hypothetical protein